MFACVDSTIQPETPSGVRGRQYSDMWLEFFGVGDKLPPGKNHLQRLRRGSHPRPRASRDGPTAIKVEAHLAGTCPQEVSYNRSVSRLDRQMHRCAAQLIRHQRVCLFV